MGLSCSYKVALFLILSSILAFGDEPLGVAAHSSSRSAAETRVHTIKAQKAENLATSFLKFIYSKQRTADYIVVYFSSESCPPCRRLAPLVDKASLTVPEEEITFIQLDDDEVRDLIHQKQRHYIEDSKEETKKKDLLNEQIDFLYNLKSSYGTPSFDLLRRVKEKDPKTNKEAFFYSPVDLHKLSLNNPTRTEDGLKAWVQRIKSKVPVDPLPKKS